MCTENRYCKGCEKDVTKTMYCDCGDMYLSSSHTYTETELIERDKVIDEHEKQTK